MMRWIIAVLFSILVTCPAVSAPADETSVSGGSTSNYPSSNFGRHHHSKKNKDEEAARKKKEKEAEDKKVDDAIKKAWEEN